MGQISVEGERTWGMMGLQHPVCVLGVSNQLAVPLNLQAPWRLLQQRRPGEGLHDELCLGGHLEYVHQGPVRIGTVLG